MNSVIDTKEKERRQKRLLEEIDNQDKAALMALLDSTMGRWFLMRLLDRCGVFTDIFTGNSKTFYQEGMRKIGLMYLQDITQLGLTAVELKQEAELEYIKTQQEFARLINEEGDEYGR